ncbi:MAG TPA: CBS domain-containing protein [Burkholderiales bacterium]|nr:CBS domain-containing protein [Burkholderiales bacterium]
MPTTVGQICNREVVFATRETTASAAAKLMRHHHVGSLVVVDETNGGRMPVGIVTDRDIVIEITAVDLDPATITVGDIMEPNLVTARESDGILEAMEIMRYRGVRRLPVVTEQGKLAGIVTMDDLIELLAEELGELAKIVAREQAREKSARK